MNPEPWILAWLDEHSHGMPLDRDDNYFEKGAIDSFGAIELVEAIETQFAIRFDDQDFQDKRFYTVEGVAAIVAEKRG